MHSSVFVYTENKNLRKEELDVTEDSLLESGFSYYCDYVNESRSKSEFDDMFKWLETCLEKNNKIIINNDEKSFTFLPGSVENYFKERFERFKAAVDDIDLTQFCSVNKMYDLDCVIEDKHEFYMVDEYGSFCSLDRFMREVAENLERSKEYKIYILKTMDYHF